MENVMIYLKGNKKSFHCTVCEANVFHHVGGFSNRYECNSCGTQYMSDDSKEEDIADDPEEV